MGPDPLSVPSVASAHHATGPEDTLSGPGLEGESPPMSLPRAGMGLGPVVTGRAYRGGWDRTRR